MPRLVTFVVMLVRAQGRCSDAPDLMDLLPVLHSVCDSLSRRIPKILEEGRESMKAAMKGGNPWRNLSGV